MDKREELYNHMSETLTDYEFDRADCDGKNSERIFGYKSYAQYLKKIKEFLDAYTINSI